MVTARPTYLSKPLAGKIEVGHAKQAAELMGTPLFRQGITVAKTLEATKPNGKRYYPTVGILMPRRSTKTTSIWATLIGRCLTIPGHRVVTTAQDGIRAREKFREVARALEAHGFEEKGIGNIRWASGTEHIMFANQSRLWVVSPKSGAFRSEAADDMLFDEAGELDPDMSEDLMAGALPLMDTRPRGQVIIAGTPSLTRAGLLWETLEDGRAGKAGTGIVDFSARDGEETVYLGDDEEWHLNEDLLRRVHPGVGTLTDMETMYARFEKMGIAKFEREYFCRFPKDVTLSAIDQEKWKAAAGTMGRKPERFSLAFDVAPDSSYAAIMAAWRDDEGKAHVEVLAYQEGASWVAKRAHDLGSRLKVPIAYDPIGANTAPAEAIHRMRPNVRLAPTNFKGVQAAAQVMVADIHEGRFVHYDQPDLNAAAETANWRDVEGGRVFGRKVSKKDITTLVAASIALRDFDNGKPRARMAIRSTMNTDAA